jgi:hypothetical protein
MNIAILVNNIENNTNGGDTIARLNLNSTEYRTNLVRLSTYLEALATGAVSGVNGSNKCIVGGFTNAYGTITLSSTGPVATNTFTLNGVTFTAIASGATGNQFNIGGSLAATAANIASAINASTSDAVSGVVSASSSGAVVTISALAPGKLGNGNTVAAGTFANGAFVNFSSSGTKGIEVSNVSF